MNFLSNTDVFGFICNSTRLKLLRLGYGEMPSKVDSMFWGMNVCEFVDMRNMGNSNLVNINNFIGECWALKRVYVGEKWITKTYSNVSNSFRNDYVLVGGNGTVFNSNYTDKTYAKIDKPGEPGYFTYKASN